MSDVPIQIVDENDEPVSIKSKDEAHNNGLIHRVSGLTVEDEKGNVLLQLRSASKSSWPNAWDNSAAGHVDAGEDYLTAVLREAFEEIGVKLDAAQVEETAYYRADNTINGIAVKRFKKVYKTTVPHDTKFILSDREVAEVKWFTTQELRDLLHGSPDKVTDGLREVITKFYL